MSRLLDAPEADRNRWSSNWSFILASVGSAIGFGNIWRFPKLCYEFGGGAFLIPYLAALFFFTIPVVVLEFALGQNFQVGHVRMMSLAAAQVDSRGRPTSSSGSSAPAGLGWAAVLGTYLLSQFYMALLAITLCYVVASFSGELPWSDGRAHAFFLATTSPSAGVEESGGLVPNLAAAYAVVWLLVTLGAVNASSSIELMNKIVMPVPFIVLVAFLIRGLSLPGAGNGVLTLFRPDPSYLLSAEVWLAAIGQLFFGVSAGLGTLTTYASFNPHETPIVRSAVLVCLGNSTFSLLAGVTVFAFLGHLAHEQGVPVTEVVAGGTSLAFEVFPVAFSTLPLPNVWAICFFLMLLNLGISSAVSMTAPLCIAVTEALAASSASDSRAPTRGKAPTIGLHLLGFSTGLLYVTRSGYTRLPAACCLLLAVCHPQRRALGGSSRPLCTLVSDNLYGVVGMPAGQHPLRQSALVGRASPC